MRQPIPPRRQIERYTASTSATAPRTCSCSYVTAPAQVKSPSSVPPRLRRLHARSRRRPLSRATAFASCSTTCQRIRQRALPDIPADERTHSASRGVPLRPQARKLLNMSKSRSASCQPMSLSAHRQLRPARRRDRRLEKRRNANARASTRCSQPKKPAPKCVAPIQSPPPNHHLEFILFTSTRSNGFLLFAGKENISAHALKRSSEHHACSVIGISLQSNVRLSKRPSHSAGNAETGKRLWRLWIDLHRLRPNVLVITFPSLEFELAGFGSKNTCAPRALTDDQAPSVRFANFAVEASIFRPTGFFRGNLRFAMGAINYECLGGQLHLRAFIQT